MIFENFEMPDEIYIGIKKIAEKRGTSAYELFIEISKKFVENDSIGNNRMSPKKFKEIRKKVGLKQMELKDMLHVSQSSITNYENGTIKIPEHVAKQMLDIESEGMKK